MKILTFNVLNGDPSVSQMLFKNSDELKNYCKKYNLSENKIARSLGMLDYCYFSKYRIKKIIEFVKYYFDNGYIVLLQEVNKKLLDKLSELFEKYLYYTDGTDYCISSGSKSSRVEYRVSIIPDTYIVKNTKCILFETDKSIKQQIKITISEKDNEHIEYDIFNLHLHHASNKEDIEKHAKIILENISSDNIFVCGDYNCNIESDKFRIFKNILGLIFYEDESYTSYTTDSECLEQKTHIDFIGRKCLNEKFNIDVKTHVIQKFNENEIFCDLNKLFENLELLKFDVEKLKDKKYMFTLDDINLYKECCEYLSDHKPVELII